MQFGEMAENVGKGSALAATEVRIRIFPEGFVSASNPLNHRMKQ